MKGQIIMTFLLLNDNQARNRNYRVILFSLNCDNEYNTVKFAYFDSKRILASRIEQAF